ncbi:MAG: SPOR domain-containing protein [Gammaproteobacteria bacterium]|nr:SPOR domain-containing protein [Gammaproteobacteria bacterium]
MRVTLDSLQDSQSRLSTELERVTQRMEQSTQAQTDLTRTLEVLFRETMERLGGQIGRAHDALKTQQEQLESLEDRHEALDQQQQSLLASSRKQGLDLNALKASADERLQNHQGQIGELKQLQRAQADALNKLDAHLDALMMRAEELGLETHQLGQRIDGLDLRSTLLEHRADDASQQLTALATEGAVQRRETRSAFQRTAVAMAVVTLGLAGAMTYLHLNPTTVPVVVQQQLDGLDTSLTQHIGLTATLSGDLQRVRDGLQTLQATVGTQGNEAGSLRADLGQLGSTLAAITQDLGRLEERVRYPDARGTLPVLPIQDAVWLATRDSGHYSIQLVGVRQFSSLADFVNRNAGTLAHHPIAFSKASYQGSDWFNLYYGDFATLAEARAALAGLPPTLKANQPWVRSIGAIQRASR